MRFYLNPCFTKYSFDKSEKRRMPKKDHNFNQSCDTSNGSSNSTGEHLELSNHGTATFDLGDNYQVGDSLTMEYRGQLTLREKELRKRNVRICGIVAAVVLIIIAAVITFVAIHVMKNGDTNMRGTECATKHIGEDTNDLDQTSTQATTKKPIDTKNVCTTKRCKFIAENLEKSMNFSVDPCENFHEYACGLWPTTHPLPPSLPKLDTMGTLNIKKNLYLKNVIEQEMTNSTSANPKHGFKSKILRFYKSCLDIDSVNRLGKEPLLNFISKFGRWSPLKQWIQKDAKIPDVTDLLIESHQYFPASVYDDRVKSPLFKTIVKVNDNNSSQHLLEMNLPDLPITNPENYISASKRARTVLAKYQLLQTNYVALLGPSYNAKKVLKELMYFEKELANITIDSSFLRNAMQSYNQTSIKDFAKEVGTEIDWLKLVKGFFAPHNIKITEETFIGVRSINFFKNLNSLIKRSKKQTVKDYIIWVCIWRFGSYASGPFQEADYNFQKAIEGIQERPKRWYKCIVDVEETMEFGLAWLYIRGALTAEGKVLATEILKNITNAFRRNLVNVEWMDVSTKAKAFEKVDSIRGNIGYPDYVRNETYLDILYERVIIHNGQYFTNALNMYRDKRGANMLLLTQPVDRTAYDLPPTLVEAYFDPNKNKMVFLAGIMHVPFYDIEGPMAMNYGALGLVVGHEVTHAFDDLGRMFDGNGEKKNWWTKTSTEAFTKRSSCMVQQYNSYTMYGEHVNGALTIGENIADNGGIRVAYMAYKEWERMHGMEKSLPGIPLNMDQLLFVSHGQVWCGAYREEYIKRALKTDYHSPAKYRIIGPLSNLKEFSDAFKCPLGSPMNPVNKCRVW